MMQIMCKAGWELFKIWMCLKTITTSNVFPEISIAALFPCKNMALCKGLSSGVEEIVKHDTAGRKGILRYSVESMTHQRQNNLCKEKSRETVWKVKPQTLGFPLSETSHETWEVTSHSGPLWSLMTWVPAMLSWLARHPESNVRRSSVSEQIVRARS